MDDYMQFIAKVKRKTGIDLSLYKEAQMKRRLAALYAKKGLNSFSELFAAMEKDPALWHECLDRMTINVSEFYRNAKRWEVLEQTILPRLLAENPRPRVWSAACSTGEEPYTLAMVLAQHVPLSRVSVLATDIDENALARARLGLYSERSLAELPEAMRKKFFTKDGDWYKIDDKIKRTVTFEKHNLLADPFPRPFDLIVCRNVLIYFTEEAKRTLYRKFHAALRPGGVLFVGSTEQIFNPGLYGFEMEETFFYRRK
ncbi:protein-glutamate O-methyltransferase CheR [Geobacillus sp. FSL W8-0032]|uniref:protein-glutamate O-methyltransferase n=1 Tax=Geobacillus icigianus TaxID=1430331 RepID=A0ABU6BK44_9BACL|nr:MULTISPECIES: protein-glutamate O-methyltransferase CheR [Geobacillus]KYD28425.1 Chemotaxis protein methyltransferase CheR [Geobacillus sp. B4113_201601]MEB3752390.1 Chemotaxis protein methyltransferase [Geobacillus icigianus]